MPRAVSGRWRAGRRARGRGHVAVILGSGGFLAANAVAGLLIARFLGPAGRGEVSYAFLLMSIGATLGTCGTDFAATHLLSSPAAFARGTVRRLSVIALALASAAAAITVVGALVLRPPLNPGAVLLGIVGFAMTRVGSSGLLARRGASLVSWTRALAGAAYLAATVVLLAGRATPASLVLAWSALGALPAAVYLGWLARTARPGPSVDADVLRHLLRDGRKGWHSSLVQAVNYRLDQLAVLLLLDAAALGQYSVAVFVLSVLWLLADGTGEIEYPAMTQLDEGARQRRARVVALRVTAAVAVLGALVVVLAPVVVPLVIGPGYDDVPVLLLLLYPGTVATAAGKVAGAALLAGRHTGLFRRETMRTGLLVAVLVFPAVRVGGLVGAAVLSSAAYLLLAVRLWLVLGHIPAGVTGGEVVDAVEGPGST